MPITQTEIDSLKAKRDAAQSVVNSAKSSMDTWCQVLYKYNFTEGTNRLTCSQKVSPVCEEPMDAICCRSSQYSWETCERDKNQYNIYVNSYELALDSLERAQSDLELALEGKVDEGGSKLEREAKEIRTRYYVFGGIAIVLILAGIFVYMKYFSKK